MNKPLKPEKISKKVIEEVLKENFPEAPKEEIKQSALELMPSIMEEVKNFEMTPMPSIIEEIKPSMNIMRIEDFTPLPTMLEEKEPEDILTEQEQKEIQPDDVKIDYNTVISLLPKQEDTLQTRKRFLENLPLISKDYLSLKTVLQYYEIPVGKLSSKNRQKKINLILKEEGFLQGSGMKRKKKRNF